MNRHHRFLISWLSALTIFTIYAILTVFLIPRAYRPFADAGTSAADRRPDDPEVSAASYADDNIRISIARDRYAGSAVYVADISLSSLAFLKTAFANDTFGRNITETVWQIAERKGAILAVNGDFYGAHDTGFVLREGTLYRDTVGPRDPHDLVIYPDGRWQLIREKDTPAASLAEKGAWDIFSFGPLLLKDGEILISGSDNAAQGVTPNPRTVIARYSNLHYAFIVVDGRTAADPGLTLAQLAAYLKGLGIKDAYNLDGGGSSTLVFNGSLINRPSTQDNLIAQRPVSDIVYIGY